MDELKGLSKDDLKAKGKDYLSKLSDDQWKELGTSLNELFPAEEVIKPEVKPEVISEEEKRFNYEQESFNCVNNAYKEISAQTTVASASELNKELSSVTADSSIQAAALNTLSSLPFDKLIGGPLEAAIAAQSKAAKSTLQYIQAVGMRNDKVIVVSFEYVVNGVIKKFQIPLLTLVPIPNFAIKTMDYTFKVKVNAESKASASMSTSIANTWNAGFNASAPAAAASAPKAAETKAAEAKPAENLTEEKKKEEAAKQVQAAKDQQTQKADEKKAQSAEAASKAAETAASTKSSGMSLNATISTKKDSLASRESKYSVEANMDITISAGQDDLPAGVLTLLEVLNKSNAIFDPDGELTVSPSDTITLGTNGKATAIVQYLNEEGVYDPTSVVCSDAGCTKDIISRESVRLTFSQAGVYTVTAGLQVASITVKE